MNEQLKYLSPEWFRAEAEKYTEYEAEKKNLRKQFCDEFSPEKLKELSGKSLLNKIFYSDNNTNDSLCYHIERNSQYRPFGGIRGGSAYKFGLFYHKQKNCWQTGSSQKPVELSEEEAIKKGTEIRDSIVKGTEIIEKYKNATTTEEYEKLSSELEAANIPVQMWVMKYFHMLYPDIITEFYSDNWQKHVLNSLNIVPHNIPIVRMGQIALFVKQCNISSDVFGKIFHTNVGGIKNIPTIDDDDVKTDRYWIYAPGDNASKWDEFYDKGIMGIGWNEIGDLREYSDKNEMKQAMKKEINPNSTFTQAAHITWQFANEMKPGDIVFAKKGMHLIVGRGIVESDYEFDPSRSEYKSIRKVKWTHKGKWQHPGQAVMKTLTDITSFTDYVEKLNTLFESDDIDNVEEKEITYPHYDNENFLEDVYMDEKSYNILKSLINKKKNVILQGAPGVGKTYAAKRLAYSIMGVKDTERVMMVQFHQSYSYEDFIEGIRPSGSEFTIQKGAFYKFCKKAEIDSANDYFFIIDEINRGNLSKIFGELFMLIESDKRGLSLQLLYSHEKFAVPKNVHIIGMMNTADRSLAMLDYALRRRFAFFEMRPGFDSEGFQNYCADLNNGKFNDLISCVKKLNKAISEDESLSDGFCIGHSYFCNLEPESINDQDLYEIVEFELIPLLKEYWFDEPNKVNDWSDKLRSAIK